jgi:quercetin dioxygenase-like cupin family protein
MREIVLLFGVAVFSLLSADKTFSQTTDIGCKPVDERRSDVGCWIIASHPIGQIASAQTFWHLDTYPTQALAEGARGPHGLVVESLGKTWLLSIEASGWQAPPGGEHVADVGPLPVTAGGTYAAQYLEAVFTPGMTSAVHVHGGPEAWYTLSGETCLETPDGKQVGRAGGQQVIVPGGPPMHLTATGTEQRRAIVLILHDTSKPATTIVHDWSPTGLCNKP